MGFLVLAKHGLNKTWDLNKFGLILEDQTVERERGEEKREEEEENKKRREEEGEKFKQDQRYGTMTINMNTCFGLYGTTLGKDFFN